MDDFDRAEQGACLMLLLGCQRVSVVEAVAWWRRVPELWTVLEEAA